MPESYHDYARITGDAATPTEVAIVDDFEDGDLSEYNDPSFTNSGTEVQTSVVYEGTYALKMQDSGGATDNGVSLSGLPNYPDRGDTIRYFYRPEGAENQNVFRFGAQDGDNFYEIVHRGDNNADQLALRERVFGTSTTISSVSNVPYNFGEWHRVRVDWGTDDVFNLAVFDASGNRIADTSGSSSSFASGGIGWENFYAGDASNYPAAYFDECEFTEEGVGSTGVVDSFEDQDLSEYTVNSTDPIEIASGGFDGSYSVTSNTGGNAFGSSNGGLDRYPSIGQRFSWRLYLDSSGSDENVLAGWGSPSEVDTIDEWQGYDVNVSPEFDVIALQRKDTGGSNTNLATVTPSSFPRDEWSEVVVEWRSDGTLAVDYNDAAGNNLASTSATDTTYSGKGIMFRPIDPARMDFYNIEANL